jgi:hypothetical protein
VEEDMAKPPFICPVCKASAPNTTIAEKRISTRNGSTSITVSQTSRHHESLSDHNGLVIPQRGGTTGFAALVISGGILASLLCSTQNLFLTLLLDRPVTLAFGDHSRDNGMLGLSTFLVQTGLFLVLSLSVYAVASRRNANRLLGWTVFLFYFFWAFVNICILAEMAVTGRYF